MPYGEMLMENTTMDYDNPYRFNSKELDMATGYYYYGARYYDPKRSFWLSVDPLSEITQSPYAYVWNDPVNFADPTGLMGERVGGPGHGPKTIKDCFGGGDNYGPDPLPKHMRTAAIRIAAAGVNSVGSGQFKGNSGAEKLMNKLMINYAGSHDMTLGQMASMQNEIGQFYQGLILVRGWDKETYDGLYTKVIKNLKLNHEGVQYGTGQAIKEAENNWGVLGMAGEVSAMIAAEGLFPVNAGKIKPRGIKPSGNVNPSAYEDAIAAETLRDYRAANTNIDCSELASGYNRMYKGGYVLEITPSSGKWLNGIEYGKKEAFTYHQVYVKGNYVYDPMYSGTPIRTKDYIKVYQKMNPKGIKLQRQIID
ncbi:hypothetical protein ACM40_06075 [Chryseobacterium sp. BLS98]|uniref:RHS repeat domain-containing protein n=1 Tax=Chryseobacterium sp. BLS98 TaxID=885586 RepID=UPI00065AC319|nr:RHS repeat-associated core domain-containing protein [Chryseobacterium sp. BLS98]KMQ61888.1 hypothetical protein ACM40_06075 [Chryseobacterium sp. BLS98]